MGKFPPETDRFHESKLLSVCFFNAEFKSFAQDKVQFCVAAVVSSSLQKILPVSLRKTPG